MFPISIKLLYNCLRLRNSFLISLSQFSRHNCLVRPKPYFTSSACNIFVTNEFFSKKIYEPHKPTKIIKEDGTVVRRKTEREPKIFLIHNNKLSVVTMTEAKTLAAHERLHLVEDKSKNAGKSQKPTYKLLTNAEFLSEGKLKTKNQQSEKSVLMSVRIGDHDLRIKAEKIIKMVEKLDRVKISIKCSKEEIGKGEAVIKKFTEFINNRCILKYDASTSTALHVYAMKLPEETSSEEPGNKVEKEIETMK